MKLSALMPTSFNRAKQHCDGIFSSFGRTMESDKTHLYALHSHLLQHQVGAPPPPGPQQQRAAEISTFISTPWSDVEGQARAQGERNHNVTRESSARLITLGRMGIALAEIIYVGICHEKAQHTHILGISSALASCDRLKADRAPASVSVVILS